VEQRLAVIDLGSNSFRLVVFTYTDDWWKRTDEIYEPVRVGEHQETGGPLQPEPMERALETIELFAHFCRATGIERVRPLATSAIREASNRKAFVRAARKRSGLDVEVLSREAEARYGYLAVVNSTTLTDGVALDIGGGSMQLTRVEDRLACDARSWRLGAVVTTERFLSSERVKPKHLKALREHVAEELANAKWLRGARGRLAGIGGTVRNLGAALTLEAELPSYGVQGFCIQRDALDALVERLAGMTPSERRRVPGIKPERGDLILAGAVVVQSVMRAGGFDAMEVTEAGLREGAFFEERLAGSDPPLLPDVRAASVRNLAAQYHPETAHTDHVARLALEIWDALARAGVHPGDANERELLWAAAVLHDIGTAVDYDDHHKHSRYLILNAGLPGFSPRETALIGQAARYHRKGRPTLGEFAPLARKGDDALLARCAAILRVAEQLERPRDQTVRHANVVVDDGRVELRLESTDDATISRWAAQRQADLFRRAFGRELEVVDG
jgi:exopolyphosphatase / guanosine-5'-triphosphate,3'-diphosphate pyrophosphatase